MRVNYACATIVFEPMHNNYTTYLLLPPFPQMSRPFYSPTFLAFCPPCSHRTEGLKLS